MYINLSVYFIYIRNECFKQTSSVEVADAGRRGRGLIQSGMWPSGVLLKVALGLLAICWYSAH